MGVAFLNQEFVIHLARESLMLIILLAAPALGVGLLVGVVIGILQATTQIQEQTLSFIPKIVAIFLVIIIASSWMMNLLTSFTINIFSQIPNLVK